ncbi:MAG TPA: N-6 DNA methylase [Chthoniobacterales bacterium]|nr:N-6 DNA methylase [Chthoniobacterales bacterium]
MVDLQLDQRWPDRQLFACFRTLLQIYAAMVNETNARRGADHRLREAYKALCEQIRYCSERENSPDRFAKRAQPIMEGQISRLLRTLQSSYGADWLQACASLLGMQMHFSLALRGPFLINRRRPNQPTSTYPNSPAVARLLAHRVLGNLLKRPIPTSRVSSEAADRYANAALSFRILDSSMESGQLLLAIAEQVIGGVHCVHTPSSKSAANLRSALLRRLCSFCLWGIDRSPQAIEAVQLAFVLFSRRYGVGDLWPVNLTTADALAMAPNWEPARFDGVINNPPWGDAIRPAERRTLRSHFRTLHRHTDTYIAFTELALRWLKPGGVFALVLPSQMLATQNTAKLRQFVARETELDEIIVLPRSAFIQATVRGALLIGRRQPSKASRTCRVVVYPLVKDLATSLPIKACLMKTDRIRAAGGASWWPLFAGSAPPKSGERCVPLERVARILSGVKVYARGEGRPAQSSAVVRHYAFDVAADHPQAQGAIRGRDVRRFWLQPASRHIKFGDWLAHAGQHAELRGSTRVFLRELCSRDGKLTAAVAKNGVVPLHGVLTLLPNAIDAHVLTAILNSNTLARHVRERVASFSKVDFQKITIAELRQMPIPVAALDVAANAALGSRRPTSCERALRRQLIKKVRSLLLAKPHELQVIDEVEAIVEQMYEAC